MSDKAAIRAARRREKFLKNSQKRLIEITGVENDNSMHDSTEEKKYLKEKIEAQCEKPSFENKSSESSVPESNQNLASISSNVKSSFPIQLNNDFDKMMPQNNPLVNRTNNVIPTTKDTYSQTTALVLVSSGILTALIPFLLAKLSFPIGSFNIELIFVVVEVFVISNLILLEKKSIFSEGLPWLFKLLLSFSGASKPLEKLLEHATKTLGLVILLLTHLSLFFIPIIFSQLFIF